MYPVIGHHLTVGRSSYRDKARATRSRGCVANVTDHELPGHGNGPPSSDLLAPLALLSTNDFGPAHPGHLTPVAQASTLAKGGAHLLRPRIARYARRMTHLDH